MPHRSTLAFFLSLALAGCAAPSLQVVPAGGTYSVDGDFGAVENSQQVSLSSDLEMLGLGDSENGFQPRVDLRWLGTHLSVAGLAAEFSGDGRTEAEITIGDRTIGADIPVRSDLELADLKAMLTFDLVPTDTVELGIGIALALVGVDLRLREIGTANTVETDEAFPVPLAAARLGVQLGRVGLYGEAGYIDISVSDGDLTLLDYELGASIDLFGRGEHLVGSLRGGWRGIDADAEYDDGDSQVDAEVGLSGPFLGFALSF